MAQSATIAAPGSVKELLTEEKLPLKGRSLHLSVEIREEQLLACLLDKHSNQYIAWGLFPTKGKESELSKILEEDIFNSSASSVSVVSVTNSSILVPAPYFKKEAASDYLRQQQLDKPNETTCYDYIKNLDSYNLYTFNTKLQGMVRDKFPGAVLRHHSSIFIEYVLTENKNMEATKAFVYVFNTYIDVVILKEGKLQLSNRFAYANSADFIYYLLWIYEQLQLNAEKVECVLYGEIEKSSEIFSLSSKYLKKVALCEKNELATYSVSLASLSPHKYRSLFTQYQCI